jgi:hypothetical protein
MSTEPAPRLAGSVDRVLGRLPKDAIAFVPLSLRLVAPPGAPTEVPIYGGDRNGSFLHGPHTSRLRFDLATGEPRGRR